MTSPNDPRGWLSDPTRLRALSLIVRAKIPASDVEDVVQATLADALVAAQPPTELAAFDRWLVGIARHKIADYYRRSRRHEVVDSDAVSRHAPAEPSPESARDLLRWVSQKLPNEPETTRTLEWMLREASGDRLETIAQEQSLSAPAVRQRVSRLRRFLRDHWALELGAALGLFIAIGGWFAYRERTARVRLRPEIVRLAPTPREQARPLRDAALSRCQAQDWKACLDGLDRARAIDPQGDLESTIQSVRTGAARAMSGDEEQSRSMDATVPIPSEETSAPIPSARTPRKALPPKLPPKQTEGPERSSQKNVRKDMPSEQNAVIQQAIKARLYDSQK